MSGLDYTWDKLLTNPSKREVEQFTSLTAQMNAMPRDANVPVDFVRKNKIADVYVPDAAPNVHAPSINVFNHDAYEKQSTEIIRHMDKKVGSTPEERQVLAQLSKEERHMLWEQQMITGDHQMAPNDLAEHCELPLKIRRQPEENLNEQQRAVLSVKLANEKRHFEAQLRDFSMHVLPFFVTADDARDGRLSTENVPQDVEVRMLLKYTNQNSMMTILVSAHRDHNKRPYFVAGVPIDRFRRYFAMLIFPVVRENRHPDSGMILEIFVARKVFYNYYVCSCEPPPSLNLQE